jgi:hypothetical protein
VTLGSNLERPANYSEWFRFDPGQIVFIEMGHQFSAPKSRQRQREPRKARKLRPNKSFTALPIGVRGLSRAPGLELLNSATGNSPAAPIGMPWHIRS